MKSLICPISTKRISRHTVRITGLMMASMIALYIATGNLLFILAIFVDYFIRAFTDLPASPASWLATRVERQLDLPPKPIDKAPKIFAATGGLAVCRGNGRALLRQYSRQLCSRCYVDELCSAGIRL